LKLDKNQLKLLLKQNQQAQKEVYYEHCDRLMYVIVRYVKRMSDAEEVLQDTFFKIFSKIKQFDLNRGSFNTWSHRIAINQSLMFIRKGVKFQVVEDDILSIESQIVNDGLEQLKLDDVINQIETLDEKYRTILTLKLIEGYEYREISNLLKIQEATTRKIFSRARKKLMDVISVNENYKPYSEKINI